MTILDELCAVARFIEFFVLAKRRPRVGPFHRLQQYVGEIPINILPASCGQFEKPAVCVCVTSDLHSRKNERD